MKNYKERIFSLIEKDVFYSKKDCDWIIENINEEDNKNLLDVGCGEIHAFYLYEKLKNFNILGIDFSDKTIKNNLEFTEKKQIKNLTFIKENILNFNSQLKFDYIISSRILHDISDKNRLFEKYSKLLNKGGKLIITEYVRKKFNLLREIQNIWRRTYLVKRKNDLVRIARQKGLSFVKESPLKCFCGKEYQVIGFIFQK